MERDLTMAEAASMGEHLIHLIKEVDATRKGRRFYLAAELMPPLIILPHGLRMVHIGGNEWEIGPISDAGADRDVGEGWPPKVTDFFRRQHFAACGLMPYPVVTDEIEQEMRAYLGMGAPPADGRTAKADAPKDGE